MSEKPNAAGTTVEAKRVTVEAVAHPERSWTAGSKVVPVGERREVRPDQAERLEKAGVAKRV